MLLLLLLMTGTLKRHLTSHGEKTEKCHLCPYVTARRSTLDEHIKAQHIGFQYQCDQCGYITGYYANLCKHRRQACKKWANMPTTPAGTIVPTIRPSDDWKGTPVPPSAGGTDDWKEPQPAPPPLRCSEDWSSTSATPVSASEKWTTPSIDRIHQQMQDAAQEMLHPLMVGLHNHLWPGRH